MGLVLLAMATTSIHSISLPRWLLVGVAAVSALMHSYIIVFMGIVGLRKRNFMVWNAKSCTLTQLFVFVAPLSELIVSSDVPWSLMHTLSFIAFALLPLLMFVRRCPDPCLSHSYFAPNWCVSFFVFVFVVFCCPLIVR